MAAAVMAARYARDAASETKRSAVAAESALEHARQANRIAEDTANFQTRSWMKLEARVDGPFTWENGTCTASFQLEATNEGSTPGLDAWIRTDIFVGENVAERVDEFSKETLGRDCSLYPDTVFPNCKMPRPQTLVFDMAERELVAPTLIGIVQYRTIFDGPNDPFHQTVRVWDLSIKGHPTSVLYKSMTPINEGVLQLIPNQIHPGGAT